jgi:hypothetical protein
MNPNATQNLVKVGSVQEIKDLETPKKRKRDVGLVYIGSEIIDDEGDDDMKRVRP